MLFACERTDLQTHTYLVEQINDNNNDNMNATTKSLMQLQKAFLEQYLQHAKPWATLIKQQNILDGTVLQCWIFLDSTVYL